MKNWLSSVKRIKDVFSPIPFSAVITDLLNEATSIKSLDQRITWFENILLWLKKDAGQTSRYVRFRYLFQLLRQRPEWRTAFVREVTRVVRECPLLGLYLQTGFAAEHGLVQEVARRLLERVLPEVRENNFLEITHQVFRSDQDIEWFAEIPEEVLLELALLFNKESAHEVLPVLRENAREAILVFAARLSYLGLTREIRLRSHSKKPSQSPFFELQENLTDVLNSQSYPLDKKNKIQELVDKCHGAIRDVYEDMEESGASVGLVYRLEVMTAVLERIHLLLGLFDEEELRDHKTLHLLFVDLVWSSFEGRSTVGHVRQQLHLISRKIAERNGHSGEHYIARSKKDRHELFYSSLKGGLIVVMMTLGKMGLIALKLPLLLEAVLVWGVYSTGFLAMQFTHATLATKLPSFTASRLARLMNDIRHASDIELFVSEVKMVLRSQAVAFLGNLMALIPLALLLDMAVNYAFGRHVVPMNYAFRNLESLHPIFSLAVPLGALTGVLLWLSSLAGGWFENWVVYQRLPLAISGHRKLRQIFGGAKADRLGSWIQENASGLSANISLGFLFGFVPFLGFIIGVPLDSQHVTISSTSGVLALLSVFGEVDFLWTMVPMCVGLFLIGLMNLSVSFALALVIAARASALSSRRFKLLTVLILRRLFLGKTAHLDER